jgi:rubrerythrin
LPACGRQRECSMTPIEALQLALTKEQNAIDLYERLSQDHKAIQELLLFLLNEEEKHKKLIQDKITELTRY